MENNRPKMTIANRAKLFAPFNALTGLNKALAAREKIIVEKPVLSEESLADLDLKMHKITPGQIIEIVYYSRGECIKYKGMVAKIEHSSRIIQIVNRRIAFDDILDLDID